MASSTWLSKLIATIRMMPHGFPFGSHGEPVRYFAILIGALAFYYFLPSLLIAARDYFRGPFDPTSFGEQMKGAYRGSFRAIEFYGFWQGRPARVDGNSFIVAESSTMVAAHNSFNDGTSFDEILAVRVNGTAVLSQLERQSPLPEAKSILILQHRRANTGALCLDAVGDIREPLWALGYDAESTFSVWQVSLEGKSYIHVRGKPAPRDGAAIMNRDGRVVGMIVARIRASHASDRYEFFSAAAVAASIQRQTGAAPRTCSPLLGRID